MKDEKMITFLFGAGADSNYNLNEGVSFISPLLLGDYKEERKQLLGDDAGKYKLIYPRSRKVYLQTVSNYREEAEAVFGEKKVNELIKYYEHDYKEDEKDGLKDSVDDFCKDIYNKLRQSKENKEKNNEDEAVGFFLKYSVFFDVLDEKFNALRNIPLNSNGKKVLNAYVTVYILMIKALYGEKAISDWKYENIFNLLEKTPDIVNDVSKETYYKVLKRLRNDTYSIATTNYTNIAETVTGNNVTYLHGNLAWFEDYKNLTVYNCLEEKERKLAVKNIENIMPFILIPSGVKPIICKKEILEFYKFIEQLDKSNYLCVVGYRFNSEDNHINSIIADWLRKDNHVLIYFNYNNSLNFDKLNWAEDFSRKEIETNTDIDFEKILSQDEKKIININVGERTSITCFEKLIYYFGTK